MKIVKTDSQTQPRQRSPGPIPIDSRTAQAVSPILFPDGGQYVGEILDGKRHGHGELIFANGDRFVGKFFNDAMRTGKISYINKDLYKGEFLNDEKHGQGTYAFNDGTRYKGGFFGGLINGPGELVYPNKDRYKGDFFKNQKHGRGKFFFANGDVQEGVFHNDQITADCKLKLSDKKIRPSKCSMDRGIPD